MNILVTGGAGFIGSHTVDAALAAGHSVHVLDDLSTGTAANLPDGAELLTGDVTDLAAVEQALTGCDAVIHLAALVSVPQSLQEPARTYHVNTTGTVGLLEAARQAGVRRAVLASTCAVYGDLPGRKDEASPVQPQVPYAASKCMAEQWLQLYAVAYGMETVVLRYFNVYGPRMDVHGLYTEVLVRWMERIADGKPPLIFGDGQQTMDFVCVPDIARANVLAAQSDIVEGTYNIASGTETSLLELAQALLRVMGSDLGVEHGPERAVNGVVRRLADTSAAKRDLGFESTIGVDEGLRQLVQWWEPLREEIAAGRAVSAR